MKIIYRMLALMLPLTLLGGAAHAQDSSPAPSQEKAATKEPKERAVHDKAQGQGAATSAPLLLPQAAKKAANKPDRRSQEETAPAKKESARAKTKISFLHVPPISAQAGEPIRLRGALSAHWRVKRLFAVVTLKGSSKEIDFITSRQSGMVATIPGEWVERGLAYAVLSLDEVGVTRSHFASREDPHPISLVGYSQTVTQKRQLARFGGQRSQFTIAAQALRYGRRYQDPNDLGGDFPITDAGSDNLWKTQLEYRYRPLNLLHDFRFGIGVMRGQWPTVNQTPIHADDAPGVNYGYSEINLELHRWFSVGGRLILGANTVGFTMGGAGIARIGDIAGTHASAELETIGNVGSRTDLRFTWVTVPNMPMALGIEFTDWPTPLQAYAPDAANLYYDIAYRVGAAMIGLRLGNTKRAQSLDGGYQGGLTFAYGL